MTSAHAFSASVRNAQMHETPRDEFIWRKSRRSGYQGNCVELARGAHTVGMRNSREPDGAALWFPVETMASFLDAARTGALDDLT